MKKIRKNEGFTIIELLAVIVVLAIILAVAVPRVLRAIEESEKEAFRITGESLIKGAADRRILDMNYVPESKTYTILGGAFVDDSFPLTGELPEKGIINVSDQGLTSIAISNNKWCAKKEENEKDITVSKDPNCTINIPEVVPENCFSRTNDGLGVTITDYDNTCPKNLIIPSTLDGLPVRTLGLMSFYNNQLTSVTIPSSVETIGQQSFQGNHFEKLTIPNGVKTMGIWAFIYGRIKEVKIADSVTTIGFRAFDSNHITKIQFSKNCKTINEEVFANNDIVDLVIPDFIEKISFGAFGRNPLKTINIGSGLKTINYSSGQYTSDNANIFSWTDNLDITISPLNPYFSAYQGGIYSKDMKTIFFGTPSIATNIPSFVETIATRAFTNMNITNLTIPGTVKEIGPYAFNRGKLESLTILPGTTIISGGAFNNNYLTSVSLPNTITTLDNYTFNSNRFPNNQAFFYKRNSDGTKDLTTMVSYGGIQKQNVSIPNGVVTIDDQAFINTDLESVIIPNTVTSVGVSSFANNKLGSITIPNSVTKIDSNAFSNNQITSVTMPANVTTEIRAISTTFYDAYNPQKQEGTYTAPNQEGIWTKQP